MCSRGVLLGASRIVLGSITDTEAGASDAFCCTRDAVTTVTSISIDVSAN